MKAEVEVNSMGLKRKLFMAWLRRKFKKMFKG